MGNFAECHGNSAYICKYEWLDSIVTSKTVWSRSDPASEEIKKPHGVGLGKIGTM